MTERDDAAKNGLVPADFMGRGVAVPFSTRVLFFARLRRGEDGSLEYLVPGLTGGLEVCVIPHGKIGAALSLSIFDRALMEELELIRTVSPASVDETAVRVGLSGLGGARLMQAARARQGAEQRQKPHIQAALLNMMQKSAGQAPIDPDRLLDPEAADALAGDLSVTATQMRVPAEKLVSRTGRLSEILSPLGLDGGGEDNLYQVRLRTMEAFAADLLKWLVPEPVGPAEMAQRIAVAARETIAIAKVCTARIDRMLLDLDTVMTNWPAAEKEINANAETVAYIIDGWPRLIDEWRKVGRMDRIDQREVIELFALYLPLPPDKPSLPKQDFWNSIRQSQHRWNSAVGTPSMLSTDDQTRDKLSGFTVEAV